MQKGILISMLFFCPPILTAQDEFPANKHRCHSTDLLHRHLEHDDDLKKDLEELEHHVEATKASPALLTRGSSVTIPVVVHIFYRQEAENISEAQVRSQIDALNRDFNRLNTDVSKTPSVFAPLVADCKVKFQLAVRDENGNATTGIMRYPTQKTEWQANDDMKLPQKGGIAPWQPSQYLNLYVVNLSGSTLGFSSFPGMPARFDGVVIDYSVFGTKGNVKKPYNLGRTCVHEVGHWLGLYHTWGDSKCGDDHVSDTPTQEQEHAGTPKFPTYSACSGKNEVAMTMNFMDYVNDEAMYLFTNGQKERIWAILKEKRAALFSSTALSPASDRTCGIGGVKIAFVGNNTAQAEWQTQAGVFEYTIRIKPHAADTWRVYQSREPNVSLPDLVENTEYEICVKTDCDKAVFSEAVRFTTTGQDKGTLLKDNILRIAPNPTAENVTVWLDAKTGETVSWEIFNVNGALLQSEKLTLSTPSVKVDFSGLTDGLYFLSVTHKGVRAMRKVMKNSQL